MPYIFLSYARTDQTERGRVLPLVAALEHAGYDIYYDVELLAGESWADVLREKIERASCVIVLWSERSVQSDWVREEASLAKEAGKLVPVFIDDVKPPFGFSLIHGASLWDWQGDSAHAGFCKLLQVLEQRLGGTLQPIEAPDARGLTRRAWAGGAVLMSSSALVLALWGLTPQVHPLPALEVHPPPQAANPWDARAVVVYDSGPGLGGVPTARAGRPAATADTAKPVPADIAEVVSKAQSALQAGDSVNAIRLAQVAMRRLGSPLPAAMVVLAKAYCQKRDLGMANAVMRSLSAAERRGVQEQCASFGLRLGE